MILLSFNKVLARNILFVDTMRWVELSPHSNEMFEDEVNATEIVYFAKHKECFQRMWTDQRKVFWRRFVFCFKLYIQKYLYPRCKIEDRNALRRCVEEMQDYILFNYCNAKFGTARAFMNNLVILGLSTERIANIGKGYTKDPFYGKQSRGTYRGLFGNPDSPVTYLKKDASLRNQEEIKNLMLVKKNLGREDLIGMVMHHESWKVMLIQPMYLRFFHAVITLMRVWQGSPDCSDDDDSYCPRYILEEMLIDRIKKIAESSSEDESSNPTTSSSQKEQEHEQLKDEQIKQTADTNNTEKPKAETQRCKISRKTLKANAFAAKKLHRMKKNAPKIADPEMEYNASFCIREKKDESTKLKREHDCTAVPPEPCAEQLAFLEDFTKPDFYFQQASHHDEDLTFEFMTMDDGCEVDLADVVRFHECTSCFALEQTPDMFKQCKRCEMEHWLLPKYYCSQKCQVGDWSSIHRQEHKAFKNDHLEPRRQNVFWP
uniref:uncharacterized protein isoform X2 n=1 Tax=Myxine glutinosa TaxID=7769 RepID=UPI0035901F7C